MKLNAILKWSLAAACSLNMLPVSVFAKEKEPSPAPEMISVQNEEDVLETEESTDGLVIAAPGQSETPEEPIEITPEEKTEEVTETPAEEDPPVIIEDIDEEDISSSEPSEDVEIIEDEDEEVIEEEDEEIVESVDRTDGFVEAELDKHAEFTSMKLKVSRQLAVEVFADLGEHVEPDDYLLVNIGGQERHYKVAEAGRAYSVMAGKECTVFTIRLSVGQIDEALGLSLVVDGKPGPEITVSVAGYANTILGRSGGAQARFLRAMLNYGRHSSCCAESDHALINAAKEYIEAVKEYRAEN